MRAGTGIAMGFTAGELAEKAAKLALDHAGLSSADAALVFATAACGPEMDRVTDVVSGVLGTKRMIGASMHGVFSGEHIGEQVPAVAVMAMGDVDVEFFGITDASGDEHAVGQEVLARLGDSPAENDWVVVLPDAQSLLTRPLVAGLREHLAPAMLVGAGATGIPGHPAFQWLGDEVFNRGVAGFRVRSRKPPRVAVAHAFRPPETLYDVTREQGNWIFSLNGRPALDVYREHAGEPLAEDLRHAARSLRVCSVMRSEEAQLGGSDSVVGFDEARRAFALPRPLARGDRLGFVVQEPTAAREQLVEALHRLGEPAQAMGLAFSTQARGAALFGDVGLEPGLLERHQPGVPLLGCQGAFSIGPSAVVSAADVLSASAVIAFLDS